MSLIFVDCEDIDVVNGTMREFGAVEFETEEFFHGILYEKGLPPPFDYTGKSIEVFDSFSRWLSKFKGRPVFVSDNPAYDWQGINYHFLKYVGTNPFGHSARRIGDFYAGIFGNFYERQNWKEWRVPNHDHNPVHDALGNVRAFKRILENIKK